MMAKSCEKGAPMLNGFIRILQEIKRWKVSAGTRPGDLTGPGIIFFPVLDNCLSCGLAGFITIKGRRITVKNGIPERIAAHIDAVCSNDISKLISGKTDSGNYLKPDTLQALEKDLHYLKQDACLQHELCCGKGIELLKKLSDKLVVFIENEDALIEKEAKGFPSGDLEVIASRMISLKDFAWALREDILKNQDKILGLAGAKALEDTNYYCRYHKINSCLNALDRLEVRGRDSAGLQVMVQFKNSQAMDSLRHALDQQGLSDQFILRCSPSDLLDGSIHHSDTVIAFTYKTAQITGQLGDNTSKLRNYIKNDSILKAALSLDAESEAYLSHTRWASVGAINEINCHPVNSHTIDMTDDLRERRHRQWQDISFLW